ncbi:TIGR02530 family flagellar biosynthesis protein [Agathobacter sp.]|uniref:TIGR02530 family flagellar biosynthesis protein n=1 Tax=Agathobacter sp. TaxID=2021311 RepID=UPI002A90CFCA|nr:TIGR02530 family flagellar biosynthesis protein [Agathobacter sp.]MDY5862982.1 TIGR02530 family flagellar biosynthesis protein [Agathobacter sp.]
MKNIINQYSSIEQMTNQYLNRTKTQKNASSEVSFEDVLRQKQKPLKFSKHATQRLSQRNINLSDEQNVRLTNGVTEAEKKGVNESLVLVDNLAFIVNVPNKTVVTAMDQEETNANVFTNIDGAVIM